MQVILGSQTLPQIPNLYVLPGLTVDDQINQRSVADLYVVDVLGAQSFVEGTPLDIYDDTNLLVYAGTVADNLKTELGTTGGLLHHITGADNHYLADKRTIATSYAGGTTCGADAGNILTNWLAAEGVYAVRNVLTANQSNVETNTAGFSANNSATLTRDTTTSWQGSASLKVVTGNVTASEGVFGTIPVASLTPGQRYTFSFYAKGAGSLRVVMEQSSPLVGIASNSAVAPNANTWTRYTVSGVLPSPLVGATYAFAIVTTSQQAATFWVDGLLWEPSSLPQYPVTNLFTLAQSEANGAGAVPTTQYEAHNQSTLSYDTSQAWEGAQSVKVVCDTLHTFEGITCTIPQTQLTNGEVVTASVWLKGQSGGEVVHLLIWQESPDSGIGSSVAFTLTTSWQRCTVSATLPNPLLTSNYGLQINNGGTLAETYWADGFQLEAGAAASPWVVGGQTTYVNGASVWEVGGTSTIQAGLALSGAVAFNYKQASYALDTLAQLTSFIWWIDQYRRFYFVAPATYAAPWTFDGTQPGTYDAGQPGQQGTSLEHSNRTYRNSQYVLGATEVTSPQTETRKGDGSTQTFPLGFPIHQVPSDIHINAGAPQTIGIKGVDTGKQWYWSKGDNNVYQDSSGTKLLATDTLSVTYVGQFDVVAYAQDVHQITTRQTLEGAGSGIVEEATLDTKLTTAAQAFQEASALLGEYSTAGKILTFATTKSGIAAGQLLTVALPAPFSLAGAFLVEHVKLLYEPNNEVGVWWYQVTATQGPVSETYVQWFTRIVSPPGSFADASSLGQQTAVALLQSVSESWTWSESVSPVVTTCPVFPMTFPITLC